MDGCGRRSKAKHDSDNGVDVHWFCGSHALRFRKGLRGAALHAPLRVWGANGGVKLWPRPIGFTMDTLGRLQAMAKARQLTLSEAVREAVADWLDNPATLAKSLPEEQREAFLAKAAAAFPPAS